MADGRWQMADGRWQMADGRIRLGTFVIIRLALFGNLAKYKNMAATCDVSNPESALSGIRDFEKAATVFKALSNPNRLIIVTAVADGERCVADLTALLGLDMSTVSSHLTVLRNVGILKSERRGTQIFYSLRKPCLLNIFCCLDDFHGDAAD
jgi:ArsR family transcriptional regulator